MLPYWNLVQESCKVKELKDCFKVQIVRLAFLESPSRKWQEDANLWEIKCHFLCKLYMLSVGGMGEA